MGKRGGHILEGLSSRLLGNIWGQVSKLAQNLFKRKGGSLHRGAHCHPCFIANGFA